MIKCIFFTIVFVLWGAVIACGADDTQGLDAQLTNLDTEQLDTVLQGSSDTNHIDFLDLLKKATKGELDFSFPDIWRMICQQFFDELLSHTSLMRNLIVICILSAILKNLSASFKQTAIGELGFYVSYIVIIMILFQSFILGVDIVQTTTDFLVEIMHGALPVMIGLIAMSGNVTSAYVFHPLVFFSVEFISSLIKNLFLPMLVMGAVLEIINYLTERDILTKFSDLVKGIVGWSLKASALFFVATLSLQSISTVALNSAVNKTAKVAVNLVPVVGQVMTGAVDTVMYWAQAVKSGFLVAAVIVILVACFVPFMKLVVMVFVYKFTAAVIQPICDDRITECIDTIGSFATLLLGSLGTVIFMFIFSIMIMMTTAIR